MSTDFKSYFIGLPALFRHVKIGFTHARNVKDISFNVSDMSKYIQT